MEDVTKSPSSPPSPASSETKGYNIHADDSQSKSDQPNKRRRRNLPGMPDPNAEVIALSPKSLQATNRFVCEICNKGFQRDQNLQLHRRGHNLPWKLRQRTSAEVRRRVYVCPEPSCIHHDPSRALGDLTGIKKHFSRKHGEKKFNCEKCAKKYAVQSDWKAHMKTCGTKEYRCDCGTLFSRRDSFITHRAFCDALAQESARPQPPMAIPVSPSGESKPPEVAPPEATSSPPPPPLTPSTRVLSPAMSIQSPAEPLQENQTRQIVSLPPPSHAMSPTLSTSITATAVITTTTSTKAASTAILSAPTSSNADSLPRSSSIFAGVLRPSSEHLQNPPQTCVIDPIISLSLSSSLYATSSLLQQNPQRQPQHYVTGPQPALSATALLQKAAQIGATSSTSFLLGLGVSASSNPSTSMASNIGNNANWSDALKLESSGPNMAAGLELGLPCSGPSSGFGEFVMGQSGIFGNKPATLDFLGLGSDETFLSSVNGGLDLANAEFSGGASWNDPSETKPSML